MKSILFLLLCLNSIILNAQSFNYTSNVVNNSLCDCNYNGPSILINQISISPSSGDGSMLGFSGPSEAAGEWIELYNPNKCDSVDISHYILGTYNSTDGHGMAFVLPPNTVVPPMGFVMVRGHNAPVPPAGCIDIVVADVDNRLCIDDGILTSRFWFQNIGSWFAFYNAQGVPQDVIQWGNPANLNDLSSHPCIPLTNSLPAGFTQIPSATQSGISFPMIAAQTIGGTFVRIPDGGNWSASLQWEGSSLTYGVCNVVNGCTPPPSCNGSAEVTVTSGTAPYTYLWDDPNNQTTAIATDLCQGDYCVKVTDANGVIDTICFTVLDQFFQLSATSQNTTCGNDNGSIEFTETGSNPYTYTWIPNVSSANSSYNLESGDYLVSVSNGSCAMDTTIVIEPSSAPYYSEIVSSSASCGKPAVVDIGSVMGGIPSYLFKIDNGIFSTTSSYVDVKLGGHLLQIIDQEGCVFDTSFVVVGEEGIESIYVPNCFTPNNDQSNDNWYVTGSCIEEINCTIVNRWGEFIYSFPTIDGKWDGKVNGETVVDGVYFYKIDLKYYSGKTEKLDGFITVLK